MTRFLLSSLLFICFYTASSQSILDDFELGSGISTWSGDNCNIDTNFNNPVSGGINTSAKVMRYHDVGGQYANVRFDVGRNLSLTVNATFTLKIYVPSTGLTGVQNNQISLKLQDGSSATPWSNQCEIIKNISLNQWQTITFDFANDPYINLDASSPAPTLRNDFNRILLQVNGENNTDQVLAYIDDFTYYDTLVTTGNSYFLVWSDEFNGSGTIDTGKWFHQTQLPAGGSWFNGEIQHYTNRTVNSSQSNGALQLIAKKENFTDQGHTKRYTSARLNSKFAFTYGRVEIRAKMPRGSGTWPAMWMLGKNITETGAYWQTKGFGTTPWPACGEIDIMEHWGNNQNFVQSAMHTPSSHGGTVNKGGRLIPTVSDQFHLYALEWTKDKMIFSIDSIVHYVYDPVVKDASTWPFDKDQYLLLNIAIEPSISTTFTEDTLEVDFVRVYQAGFASINENKPEQLIKTYPNPVIDELIVEVESHSDELLQVDLFTIQGKKLTPPFQNREGNKVSFGGLSVLPSGVYLVRVRQGNRLVTKKFIKA